MALGDFLTLEILGFLVAILVPFGIALYGLGALNNKLKALDGSVKELQKDLKDISIKFSAHLLATKELSKLGEDVKNE